MGNLKERIKATLLRRDSRRLSPSPSKNSFGRDYTSSTSTNTQPGYDASDERSDHGVRESSRSLSLSLSLSQDRAISKSGNGLDNDDSHTPTPTPDANVSAHVDKSRHNKSSQVQVRPPVHRNRADDDDNDDDDDDCDFLANRTDSPIPGPDPDPAQARVKTSAKTAPPSLQAGPDSAATANFNATSSLGNDLQSLALNSPSSRAGSSTRPTAPTTVASSANNNTTITTTTVTNATTNSAAAGTIGVITGPTSPSPGTALPSIHEHPATPPTLPATDPDCEVTSPEPRASTTTFINVEYTRDDIVSAIDDNIHSPSLLTPLTASPLRPPLSPSSFSRPLGPPRRQSILPPHQTDLVRALLHGHTNDLELDPIDLDPQPLLPGMVATKIWVKRPMASATLITINEDDLVDDVREQILRKYANSLGRQYDAPDLTLRICNREQQTSRTLQPDEPMTKVIDSYYPNGQTVDDALLIDIPSRRTPKASPNPRFYADDRPHESGTDYFPPYPPASHSHHAIPTTLVAGHNTLHFPPSMSIISGSQLPPMPSPGSTRRLATNRPNLQRMHTASPVSTAANTHTPQAGIASTDQSNHPPAAPPIPTPPAPAERTATPPPQRVSSPRPSVRTKKKRAIETPSLPSGLLDTAVPPINILIVEDNMINLRLLEAFVKRLKVRWQTAINGREAVDKWRAGGFHLVLMDIQLPIMNGLEATREIRRIEKVNSIGVFSSSASSPPDEVLPEPAEEDKLANTEMFKSPVIIVALTASSLQSDRHEALAAGCNDFLTKPVNFDWLQRKVKEWGCMQALIDFDGWRKWKDFSQKTQESDVAKKTAVANKAKPVKKNRLSMTAAA
ncbi:hypothetical protein ANO14919_048340 [Xylariales sp. No.14919]|nr:hypothetical protein ANO14919_048340 [Xylariales sp. No.14919]